MLAVPFQIIGAAHSFTNNFLCDPQCQKGWTALI